MKLFNEHEESNYYHPLTKMCYRKNENGYYEFYSTRYSRPRWIKSFMKKRI